MAYLYETFTKTVFDVQSFRISGNMYNFVKFQLINTSVCLNLNYIFLKLRSYARNPQCIN